MYKRTLQIQIEKWLFRKKILIIYGARQVGKTTLAKQILKKHQKNTAYYNCEDPIIANALIGKSAKQMKNFFGKDDFIVLDEAQSIENIGRILKIFHDDYPEIQILATGSSSFDLANKINEPLTGRAIEFKLFPLSIEEILQQKKSFDILSNLNKYLLYGMYPEIVNYDDQLSRERIINISKKYLFRDILNYDGIKNSHLVYKILQALAYQLGNEVSFTELSRLIGSNPHTVEKYIDILEKSFIIFKLPAFSTNQRKELRKTRKIYFYDLGIRNALIENFGNIELRNDLGGIWENFFILERLKNNENFGEFSQFYFWRTYDQQEIDLVQKTDEKLEVFEIKFSPKKLVKIPKFFAKTYPKYVFNVVNKDNFLEKLGI